MLALSRSLHVSSTPVVEWRVVRGELRNGVRSVLDRMADVRRPCLPWGAMDSEHLTASFGPLLGTPTTALPEAGGWRSRRAGPYREVTGGNGGSAD
eukprot:13989448-Alexandrium_andersonii.AAC.1